AVRRPGKAARAVGEAGDARALAAAHPADIELGASALRRDIGEACPVGRPAWREISAGAGDQRPLLPARDVDQPDRRTRAIAHHVVGFADVGDGATVGTDLRIA